MTGESLIDSCAGRGPTVSANAGAIVRPHEETNFSTGEMTQHTRSAVEDGNGYRNHHSTHAQPRGRVPQQAAADVYQQPVRKFGVRQNIPDLQPGNWRSAGEG